MSEERFDRIEQRLDELVSGQAKLLSGFAELRGDVSELRSGQHELAARLTRVEVTQEEMNDRIKLVAEGHATLLAAIARSEEAVKAHTNARVDPLEFALRQHLGT